LSEFKKYDPDPIDKIIKGERYKSIESQRLNKTKFIMEKQKYEDFANYKLSRETRASSRVKKVSVDLPNRNEDKACRTPVSKVSKKL
jgi:hypothetical protein